MTISPSNFTGNADAVMALITVLAEPERHKAMLAELQSHASRADEALINAREAQVKADQAVKEAKARIINAEAAEARAAKAGAELQIRVKALDQAGEEFEARRQLHEKDLAALKDTIRDVSQQALTLKERSDALDARLRDLDEREMRIGRAEKLISDREARLRAALIEEEV